MRARRPYCAAMVTLQRPHCALFRTQSDAVCFEHAQSARRRSVFYAIPQRLLTMSLRCCGDACDRTACTSAFCIFLGRLGIALRTPLWCDRGFRMKTNIADYHIIFSLLPILLYRSLKLIRKPFLPIMFFNLYSKSP